MWLANETAGVRAKELCARIAAGLTTEWTAAHGGTSTPSDYGSGATANGHAELEAPCNETHLFPNWQNEMFMVAPVTTSVFVADVPSQAAVLQQMVAAVSAFSVRDARDYYSGSWSTIALLTMSGMATQPTFEPYYANMTSPAEPPSEPAPEGPPPQTPPYPPGKAPRPPPPTPPTSPPPGSPILAPPPNGPEPDWVANEDRTSPSLVPSVCPPP
jgi:hypothetical protein